MTEAQHVFISYASEDRERFVKGFASRLRDRGVDAWLDLWEMYPGDSLVEKIFTEGIGQASTIIVVLSENSVHKPWVKEELNAAVVKRIESGCRLIPVIIDNCPIPEALKSTVQERIESIEDYEESLDRIVGAILGHRNKPVLGSPPAYTTTSVEGIPGLSKIDFFVLQEFSRRALETGNLLSIRTTEIWASISKLGISNQDFKDSCYILCNRFMLEPAKVIAPEPPYYTLTEHGLDHYLQGREPEFWKQFADVCYALANEGSADNNALSARLGFDKFRIGIILKMMQRRQYVKLAIGIGGIVRVREVLPALRRKLQEKQ